MKKVLIGLIALIAIFTLSCDKNPTVPEENPSELIRVGFNVKNYTMQVDNLKSTEDDPFSVVEHTTPYGAGNIKLVNRIGEVIIVNFEENGLDTVQIMLKEGEWKTLNERTEVSNSEKYSSPVSGWVASPYMYKYMLGTNIRINKNDISNEGYQFISQSSVTFNLGMFPLMDCIAIYDTLDLLESITYLDGADVPNVYLMKEQMINYSNGVSVFYSQNQNEKHSLKLRSGKFISIDMGEIRTTLENPYLYVGFPGYGIRKPLFIKVELLPEEENPLMWASVGLSVIGFNDTISIKF